MDAKLMADQIKVVDWGRRFAVRFPPEPGKVLRHVAVSKALVFGWNQDQIVEIRRPSGERGAMFLAPPVGDPYLIVFEDGEVCAEKWTGYGARRWESDPAMFFSEISA